MTALSISQLRSQFHRQLCSDLLVVDASGVPSNADKDSRVSIEIASKVAEALCAPTVERKLAGQTAGKRFEQACSELLQECFKRLTFIRPGTWVVASGSDGISKFEQFQHLKSLRSLCDAHPELEVAIGKEHIILPDVVVWREPELDETLGGGQLKVDESSALNTPIRRRNNELPLLHASVSCKWTIRSDRAQNARTEALNLVRNRKGRVPHIVSVTGEPLPSRLSSLALGTGDIDCVYHIALPELVEAVKQIDRNEALNVLTMLIDGKRLRDISDLPFDLAV